MALGLKKNEKEIFIVYETLSGFYNHIRKVAIVALQINSNLTLLRDLQNDSVLVCICNTRL